MPEHIHLLISEPDRGTPSTVMQVLKQRFARKVLGELRRRRNSSQASLWQETLDAGHVWQSRFYDFVACAERKRVEKLRYIHRNPVKRGLVLEPDQWAWSSFRWYAHGERGPVLVNEQRPAELKMRERQSFATQTVGSPHLWRYEQGKGGPARRCSRKSRIQDRHRGRAKHVEEPNPRRSETGSDGCC